MQILQKGSYYYIEFQIVEAYCYDFNINKEQDKELQMAKKDNLNKNDSISQAVELLLENTEDLSKVFKNGGLYKELTKQLVEKNVEFLTSNTCKKTQKIWWIWSTSSFVIL